MSNYKVLVDSSVWIEYFRNGNIPQLDQLLEEDLVCTNQLILTELVPFLNHHGEMETVEELQALKVLPLDIDWEIVRDYQLQNLKAGINKVGMPDLIILQQVITEKITLFSFDKHFKLMQKHLTFDLMS